MTRPVDERIMGIRPSLTRCESVSLVDGLSNFERVYFVESTDEELRACVAPISPKVGRAQLLALCRNRWKCGYWIRVTPPPNPSLTEIALSSL